MNAELLWQFELTWALAELHLSALVEDDFLWEPAALRWTVRRDPGGVWRPDWADTEPDPIPAPTIGWLTWHIDWWWSTATDELTGERLHDRVDVTWPGSGAAAVGHLRDLAARWRDVLTHLDPAAPSSFPWGGTDHTAAHTALWVNVELTKNIAEIGQLRLLRAAGP